MLCVEMLQVTDLESANQLTVSADDLSSSVNVRSLPQSTSVPFELQYGELQDSSKPVSILRPKPCVRTESFGSCETCDPCRTYSITSGYVGSESDITLDTTSLTVQAGALSQSPSDDFPSDSEMSPDQSKCQRSGSAISRRKAFYNAQRPLSLVRRPSQEAANGTVTDEIARTLFISDADSDFDQNSDLSCTLKPNCSLTEAIQNMSAADDLSDVVVNSTDKMFSPIESLRPISGMILSGESIVSSADSPIGVYAPLGFRSSLERNSISRRVYQNVSQ